MLKIKLLSVDRYVPSHTHGAPCCWGPSWHQGPLGRQSLKDVKEQAAPKQQHSKEFPLCTQVLSVSMAGMYAFGAQRKKSGVRHKIIPVTLQLPRQMSTEPHPRRPQRPSRPFLFHFGEGRCRRRPCTGTPSTPTTPCLEARPPRPLAPCPQEDT